MKNARRLVVATALAATLVLSVVIINQTLQLSDFAARIHPFAGAAVFWTLVAVYLFVVAVPITLLVRLPRALRPPGTENIEAKNAYTAKLTARLRNNPHLAGLPLETEMHLVAGISKLDEKAGEVIRRTATQVFTSTAISQNGSLDAVLVLTAQSKMVYELARIYYQRPTLSDLAYLYANVVTTAFVSAELEDVDIAAQVQPVISNVVGSAVSAVPGFQVLTATVVNSLMSGSANAFLTLRVGCVAKKYCGAIVAERRAIIRRSATIEATEQLGAIVGGGAKRVVIGITKAAGRAIRARAAKAGDYVKDKTQVVIAGIPVPGRRKKSTDSATAELPPAE